MPYDQALIIEINSEGEKLKRQLITLFQRDLNSKDVTAELNLAFEAMRSVWTVVPLGDGALKLKDDEAKIAPAKMEALLKFVSFLLEREFYASPRG